MHRHLLTETVISFPAAAKKLRDISGGGKSPHVSTFHRWSKIGVRGVRLEAIRLGGRWVTSVEALHRFADKLTTGGPPTPKPTSSSSQRAESADRELSSLGF